VLVVEDERIVAMDLQEELGRLGYDAYAVASSGEEAIARATERCPDIVLMDIRIEGPLDGIETAAILRERFGIPCIFLTAHADEATVGGPSRRSPSAISSSLFIPPSFPARSRSHCSDPGWKGACGSANCGFRRRYDPLPMP
jgi:CheY-like chemotaxis protein